MSDATLNRSEYLAVEYAKSKLTDSTTPEEFAKIYAAAKEAIEKYLNTRKSD